MSTSRLMPDNISPLLVYQRKRRRKNTATAYSAQPSYATEPSNGVQSAVISEAPPLAAQELVVNVPNVLRSSNQHPSQSNSMVPPSSNGNHAGKETSSKDALTSDGDRVRNTCSANDNCRSSVSILEFGSLSSKSDMVNVGDRSSSSGASVANKGAEEISERDKCILILRSQGLLGKALNRQDQASSQSTGANRDLYCLMPCKVCERMESTLNMLVCDNCEDGFHISCYNPSMTIIPKREWLCPLCLKKKHKTLKDKSTANSFATSSEFERKEQYSTSDGELGSLEFMFTDMEPYMTNVRIGDEFQADVPDWHGPINEECECDLSGDPSEINPSNGIGTEKQGFIKPLNLNAIGNWIQCRGVIDGISDDINGTICGKWRRAPLFEVQTDEWECHRCILWDPARADCAVPQELDTKEVMRQLKYIEMLRPRPGLAAKRRKLDPSKRLSRGKKCR